MNSKRRRNFKRRTPYILFLIILINNLLQFLKFMQERKVKVKVRAKKNQNQKRI
jgi:hypothetical protein